MEKITIKRYFHEISEKYMRIIKYIKIKLEKNM